MYILYIGLAYTMYYGYYIASVCEVSLYRSDLKGLRTCPTGGREDGREGGSNFGPPILHKGGHDRENSLLVNH